MAYQSANNQAIQDCIQACEQCHRTCLQMAMTHCLAMGGKHVEAEHFRLMMDCAEICQMSVKFMLSGSNYHHRVCAACAEICEACAKSCEAVGAMDDCVKACNRCAESCRKMAASAR